jgi:hypothetical protein
MQLSIIPSAKCCIVGSHENVQVPKYAVAIEILASGTNCVCMRMRERVLASQIWDLENLLLSNEHFPGSFLSVTSRENAFVDHIWGARQNLEADKYQFDIARRSSVICDGKCKAWTLSGFVPSAIGRKIKVDVGCYALNDEKSTLQLGEGSLRDFRRLLSGNPHFFAGSPQRVSEQANCYCGNCAECSIVFIKKFSDLNEDDKRHFTSGAIFVFGTCFIVILTVYSWNKDKRRND